MSRYHKKYNLKIHLFLAFILLHFFLTLTDKGLLLQDGITSGRRGHRPQFERYTLSTRGYPCHYDQSDNSCAWCRIGNQQCGKAGTWANNYLEKLGRNYKFEAAYEKENTCLPVLKTERFEYAKRPWAVCIGQGI